MEQHHTQQGHSSSQQELTAADAKAKVALPIAAKLRQVGASIHAAGDHSLSSVEAAAAAVDAASAAVAAALAEAGITLSDNGRTAAAAGPQVAAPLTSTQLKQLAVAADRWMDVSHTMHSQPVDADVSLVPGPGADPGSESSWSDLIAAVEAVEGAHSLHVQSHNSSSPANCFTARHRARSLSPIPAGAQAGRGAAVAAVTSAGGVGARQRSRSVSPLRSPTHKQRNSPSHRPAASAVHEWCRPGSPAAAGCFQAPNAASNHSPDFRHAVQPGSAARLTVLCDTQQTRVISPWRAEAAACYLSDLALDQYVRFSRRMHNQHNWQQKFLEVRTAR